MLLTGAYAWEQVTALYKERSSEDNTRDKDDIKQHWVENMCNKFKKPTGSAGGAKDFIIQCQKVQKIRSLSQVCWVHAQEMMMAPMMRVR